MNNHNMDKDLERLPMKVWKQLRETPATGKIETLGEYMYVHYPADNYHIAFILATPITHMETSSAWRSMFRRHKWTRQDPVWFNFAKNLREQENISKA